MDLGLHVVQFDMPDGPPSIAPTLGRIARAADAMGLTHLSLMDHYFQMEMLGGPALNMLEGYTTLGYFAALTERVRLGLLVTGVTYRHPGLLAKIVTTLDVLSGGRAQLGIGAAWYDREHTGLGVPYPPVRDRYVWLEDTLQICKQMWSTNDGKFEGKHFQLAETLNLPQPISRPHPPILIGGMGEKKTLRLVARYADACNLFSQPGVDVVRHKLEVLKQHCEREGTAYDRIRKTILYTAPCPTQATADAFLKEMEGYAAIGIEEVIVMPGGDDQVAQVEGLAGLVKPLAAM